MRLILLFLLTSTWILTMSLINSSKLPEEAKEFASVLNADYIFVNSNIDLSFREATMRANRISKSNDNITLLVSLLDEKNKLIWSNVDQIGYSHNSYYIKFLLYADQSGFTKPNSTNDNCDILFTRYKGSNFKGQRDSLCRDNSKIYDKRNIAVNCTHFYQSSANYSFLFRVQKRVALPEEWKPKNPPCPL
ncbi:hypothetical protein Btru_067851 [Bulinus truncatus]|nr:hypothetical protein Btru_067851 [Bulinus truncatus]